MINLKLKTKLWILFPSLLCYCLSGTPKAQSEEVNSEDTTPLLIAVKKGNLKKVISLVQRGAPIDRFIDNNDEDFQLTPLGEAHNRGFTQIAKFLEDHGASEECHLFGRIRDPDPKGANIRSKPNGSASIKGTLKKDVQVLVVHAKKSWLYVIEYTEGFRNGDPKAVDGWISASLVSPELSESEKPFLRAKISGKPDPRRSFSVGMKVTGCSGYFYRFGDSWVEGKHGPGWGG